MHQAERRRACFPSILEKGKEISLVDLHANADTVLGRRGRILFLVSCSPPQRSPVCYLEGNERMIYIL